MRAHDVIRLRESRNCRKARGGGRSKPSLLFSGPATVVGPSDRGGNGWRVFHRTWHIRCGNQKAKSGETG